MQTMLIIQLQIVPDKVLLGNRDTLQTVGESMAQNNQTDMYILGFQEMDLTDDNNAAPQMIWVFPLQAKICNWP